MRLRTVNKKLLFISAVIYRMLTVGLEFLVLWAFFGKAREALGAAVVWNIINIGWYYAYHYWFARRYKVGLE